MKTTRRILAAAMTLSLTACLVYPAFAATYDVTDEAQVQEAVNNHINNAEGDTQVILNMQNDIGNVGSISTQENWTYTFKGNGNTLGGIAADGQGTVVVNADVAGGSVSATGQTDVTVNGNVTSDSNGIESSDSSRVTVNGDISTDGSGVEATDSSQVAVNGSITADGVGIYAGLDSLVTVDKDVVSGSTGVNIGESAEVTVGGNIQASSSSVDGAYMSGSSKLTVDGNISVSKDGVTLSSSSNDTPTVLVKGDINAGNTGLNLTAYDESKPKVTVNGSISAKDFALYAEVDGQSETAITVGGDISSTGSSSAISLKTYDNSKLDYTQNGNVTSEASGLQSSAYEDSTMDVTINGNIDCKGANYLHVNDNASSNITVNGNTTVKSDRFITSAYFMNILGHGTELHGRLNHNGNITNMVEDCHAIDARNQSFNGILDIHLNGGVDLKNPEKGIFIQNIRPDSVTNVTVTGGNMVPVYGKGPNIHITHRIPVSSQNTVPEKQIPVSFQSEDLEGNLVVSGQNTMLLVYFDPADPASIAELQKGQKAFENGGTVYAVSLTEDYEAAKAAMEKAGAQYPILKNNESMEQVLTLSGKTAPVGLMIEEGKLVIPETTISVITYTESHPQLIPYHEELC